MAFITATESKLENREKDSGKYCHWLFTHLQSQCSLAFRTLKAGKLKNCISKTPLERECIEGLCCFLAEGTLPEVAGRVDGAETMRFFWEAQLQSFLLFLCSWLRGSADQILDPWVPSRRRWQQQGHIC